jgi:hypothetical protein
LNLGKSVYLNTKLSKREVSLINKRWLFQVLYLMSFQSQVAAVYPTSKAMLPFKLVQFCLTIA